MERRAIGSAAPARISKIAQAIISSSRVMPDSVRLALIPIVIRVLMPAACISGSHRIGLRLYLNCCLAGYQRDDLVLRVARIYLHDGNLRGAGSFSANHEAQQRATAAHPGRVWLPRRGNDRLAVLGIHALHDGNLLVSAGEKRAMLDIFHADEV